MAILVLTSFYITATDKDSELAARILSALGLQNEEVTGMSELSPEILSRAVFWSILMKDQRHFTFFVHSFNHIKGFQTKVEWCCTTLPLCTETPVCMYVHRYVGNLKLFL